MHAYVMYIAGRNATTSRHFHLDAKLVPKIVTQQILEDPHEQNQLLGLLELMLDTFQAVHRARQALFQKWIVI
jgi:uncharacterized membrane protein affecting hemolysin expression